MCLVVGAKKYFFGALYKSSEADSDTNTSSDSGSSSSDRGSSEESSEDEREESGDDGTDDDGHFVFLELVLSFQIKVTLPAS